ncbi:uncharacterized protein BYT42DRAFT_566268 [Radiomyces spectabilis]|uniref:uncharacterized protein n=1 Tax=Radiomyces spectabilis TaxID=64574 RepID=UPI00222012A1|nr:uncharacterized protein BYT42DRAFT_566268 [Radiomyces spectabilis]KAI8381358.1 hypothetical protein BYT42DRAFT_566268 [Radiomyces spectabilis]
MPALDLRGCLDDSPQFRKRIHAHEESVHHFENSLKTLLKLARSQVDLSSAYSQQQQELAREFLSFAQSQDDPIVAHASEKFGKSILEVEKCRDMFNAHTVDTFINPLDSFVKSTLHPVKELKKRFERSSDDVDTLLARYMSKRPKDPTIFESAKELADARKVFHQVYIEYVKKLNDIEARKKVDYMENVLAYMYTESVFHHQSYEILKDLEPYMRDLTGLLHDTRQRYNEESAESAEYQELCAKNAVDQYNPMHHEMPAGTLDDTSSGANSSKSGYLFERKGGRVLQSWTRKYYSIDGEELTCCTRDAKASKEDDAPQRYNLRVCSIRFTEGYDRRFCFEVISPMKVLVLQAENELDMLDWVKSLKMASQMALNSDQAPAQSLQRPPNRRGLSDLSPHLKLKESSSGSGNERELLKELRKRPGNDRCADCQAKDPEWAATNLGIIMCIECSGIHRSLGVHVSKVRALVLDKWETETVEIMLRIGNTVANSIFESYIPKDMESFRIEPNSSRCERDLWITEKYVKRTFTDHTSDMDKPSLDQAFWHAATQCKLPEALKYLAQGADIDYKHPEEDEQTALQRAVHQGDEIAVEFLLQWSSDVNQQDAKGWTSLHYAAAANNVHLVLTLLKRHAKADSTNNDGKTPLDLAVDNQNVQAVTALRLFAFDKQHNSSPASSLDFGFREAMSSFKHNSFQSYGSSQSALDLRQTKSLSAKEVELNDDQHSSLLHSSDI